MGLSISLPFLMVGMESSKFWWVTSVTQAKSNIGHFSIFTYKPVLDPNRPNTCRLNGFEKIVKAPIRRQTQKNFCKKLARYIVICNDRRPHRPNNYKDTKPKISYLLVFYGVHSHVGISTQLCELLILCLLSSYPPPLPVWINTGLYC
jgi:hypothetical protein